MNWAEAIERNAAALVRILAGLLASAGYADGTVAARLPGPIYRAALRVLRPMESAVRRLIVIAARDVVVKPSPVRPWVKGRVVARKTGGGRRVSFKLFDTRKRFDSKPRRKRAAAKGGGSGPRIWTLDPYDAGILCPLFRPRPAASPVPIPEPDGTVSALRLGRRLVAVKMALEDIPRQAVRLKRWETRRERIRLARPTFTSPLRIGHPPGHRKKPVDEIDFVLNECHWLAQDVLRVDTS